MPAPDRPQRIALAGLIGGTRGWADWAALLIAALGFVILLDTTRLVEPLDALLHDAIVRATPRPIDPRLLIVAIDDASLARIGRWPWPRSVHARMIDALGEAGARAVAYDVLFVDPTADDAPLAAALARSRTVALPVIVEPAADGRALPGVVMPVVPAAALGHVVVRPDRDGVFRRVTMIEPTTRGGVPHLALATLRLADSRATVTGSLVPFAGGSGHVPAISFSTVLNGEVPTELLRDRIVLVGATAAGLGDRFATAAGGDRDLMAGIEVQANIVDALASAGLRREASPGVSFAFAAGALVLLWVSFLTLSPRTNLLAVATLLAGVIAASVVLLVEAGVWIRPAAAVVAILIAFPIWGWRRLATASAYLSNELDRLGMVGGAVRPVRGRDRLATQIAALDGAMARMATLRRQRDDTLAFLSHDLRSPAAAIVALAPNNDRVAGHARRLLHLSDQFVQALRAEEAPLVIESIDPAVLLEEAADHCWEAAERVGGRVVVAAADDLPDIAVDRALMARAVINLIDNALKYGGEGPEIEVRAWFGNGRLTVTVADRGQGIAPDRVATIFTRFDRAGVADRMGVGLGLALVETFARRQDGQIACVSRAGVGTLFAITLPVL